MTANTDRRLMRLSLVFTLLVAVMAGHELEHVIQILQKNAVGAACPNDCRGLLGFAFDLEWVHFVYNTTIFAALAAIYVDGRMWRSEWRTRFGWVMLSTGLVIQGYHVVEHVAKLDQWLANGHHSPTPGLLGQRFSLVELHFTLNTVVFALVLGGYFGLGFHQRAWAGRTPARLATAAGLTVVALAGSAWIWAERPPTVRLAAGVHAGPIVIDSAQRLVGEPGAIVQGGIVITADDVVVRDLAVRGGEYGITVEGAKNVLLQDIAVSRARLDGINTRRSQVTIRRCRIESLVSPLAQGIDISFAFDLPPSRVLIRREEAPLIDVEAHDVHVLRNRPEKVGRGPVLSALDCDRGDEHPRGDVGKERGMLQQVAGVVPVERLDDASLPGRVIRARREDADPPGPEILEEIVDREEEPLNHRDHRDDGGHTDDHPQGREERSHLVGPEGTKRDHQVLAEHSPVPPSRHRE